MPPNPPATPPIRPPAAAPAVETAIPDCCNIGVVFRALLFVNLAVLAGTLLRNGWQGGLIAFVESATLTEPACLLALAALCLLRRPLRGVAPWGQRLLCALVPAAATGALIRLWSGHEWFTLGFPSLGVLEGMLVAALCGAALQHYFELRARAFSPSLVEARLQALQARIRPHFLFNSLNAVLSLIRSEPLRAETALEDLADMLRVLMRDARDMTTMEAELRLCRQYLAIEKLRLGERLQVSWETAHVSKEMLARAQMPALLLQPLLENAVRHGVEPAAAPAAIQVRIARQLERIEITIVNPLHGDGEPVGGNGLALQNIRERLTLLYDVEATLSTRAAHGLFEVRLRFPYTRVASAAA